MAKYFMAVALLILLTMEHNSMYSSIYAKSHKKHDVGPTIANFIRHSEHQNNHHLFHQLYLHGRHKRHPRKPQTHYDSDEEEKSIATRRHNYHHIQHKLKQRLEHAHLRNIHEKASRSSNHKHYMPQVQSKAIVSNTIENYQKNLRSIPKLWLHLLKEDERMYGDEPTGDSESISNELPTDWEKEQSADEIEHELPIEEEQERSDENYVKKEENTMPIQCPKCESNRQVEHITEEELTRLRIEFVKQQILEKLRLKERPKVSAVRLPKPIYEGTTIEEEDEKSLSKELDDYYARTSKKFIFLQREKRECQRLGNHPALCFSFKIDDADADSFDVNTAVLWLFKNKQRSTKSRNNTILDQETIVVSEVQQSPDTKYLPISKTIAIQSVDVQDEWLKIDIEWPIKRWFGNHELSHLIHISCQSCDIDSIEEMISVDKDYRPFIMIDMQNRRRQARQKRSINCTDGVTECCREKLYISFEEIGWGDWIILPRGYDAYFCRGSCGTVASVAQSSTHHSAFLQKVSSSRRANGRKPLELVPCCTAKQYSSLQIVFMDSNNTATQKTFPNMVVESCGCR